MLICPVECLLCRMTLTPLPCIRFVTTGNDIPLNFKRIPVDAAIQTLKLSSTGLKTLDGIGGAKKLHKLDLSNNFISDTIPDELYTLTQLESVYLSFNWFSGTLSTWIGRLSNLSGFFVDSNDLSGTLPSEIGLVSTLSSLGKCPMAYDSFHY